MSNPATHPLDSPHLLLEKALALCRIGRFPEADKILRRLVAIEPRHGEGLHFLGVVCSQLGNHAEALSNRGLARQQLKRSEDAVASYDQAIALRPGLAEAFNNRGNALQELKRFEEALASYEKAVAIKPDFAEAWNNRGAVLQDLKR